MGRMSDDELIAAIESEEANSYAYVSGDLSNERADALDRYNARPYGNERPNRSAVVSSDVRDAVEAVMPSMGRIFLSGDEIGKFEPIDQSDQGAEIESEACNWYINTRNDGYTAIYSAIKDALLLGNGYIKAWWQTKDDVKVERYQGLSDEEVAFLLQDKDIQVVEHSEYPGADSILHDVKVERIAPLEYVAIAPVPPDEIIVSRSHREVSLFNADFVQHRRTITIGELRSMGYDVPDDVAVDNEWGEEDIARERYSAQLGDEDTDNDITRRKVTFRETWYRGDVEGNGTQSLWRVCLIEKTIILKEEADLIPIASFVGIIYPHSHIGISYYSLISDVALIKTTLLRQYIDNLYLQNNQRAAIDVNRVNLDDFLVSRPGGVVRVEGEVGTAVLPLVTPDVGGAALQGLEYIESIKENRTGVARVNQGALDPNALNRTATGASLMMSAGQSRLELIARCLAGGVRDLFLTVHALAQKHSTKPIQIRLKNQFIPVNPREWVRRTDFAVSVALGTGSPEQQMGKLQVVGQFMQQGAQAGLCTRENLYNWAVEFLKAAGYRSPDKFVTRPTPENQPQPQENPIVEAEKVKASATLQAEQMKQQGTAQSKTVEMQARMQADAAKAQNEMALAERKMLQDAELAKYQADLNAETKWKEKLLEVAGNLLAQQMVPEPQMDAEQPEPQESPQMGEIMAALTNAVGQLAAITGAPRRIVRGPDGRAMGVEPVYQGTQ